MIQGVDNTSKQRSCASTNLHRLILIEVEKLTTHQDLIFFPFDGEWLIRLSFVLLDNHDLSSIDGNFFNFCIFHSCNYWL